jgi:uncharacterized membrane protein
MPRLLERINFAKVVATLAIILVVAIGACGLTALTANSTGSFAMPLGILELAVMILSAIALFVMLILWLIAAMIGANTRGGSETVRLSDTSDDKNNDQTK